MQKRSKAKAMATVMTITAALTAAGCGGGKPAARAPTGGDDGEGWAEPDDGDDPSMIPPERMDEIKTILDRKRTAAARCLADAINADKIKKNARGHLALAFVINPAGKATRIEVLEDSLASPDLERCVIAKVEQIDFGPLPEPLDWSYTFAFESM